MKISWNYFNMTGFLIFWKSFFYQKVNYYFLCTLKLSDFFRILYIWVNQRNM